MAKSNDPYFNARNEFDAFAGNDLGDPLPDDPLSALQVELYRWQRRNFGLRPQTEFALGMIEELGEIAEARKDADRVDGVADVAIFGAQLLTCNRLGLSTACKEAIWSASGESGLCDSMQPLIISGHLAQTVLKGSQKIRGLADKHKYRRRLFFNVVAMFRCAMLMGKVENIGDVTLFVARNEVLKREPGHFAIPGEK